MSIEPITIHLRPEHFTSAPTVLASCGGMTATCFRYASGVAGLTIANEAGLIELLPFQGQQIWDAVFFGRRLTMGSMFDEPIPTQDYLSTYGAFFIHCGVTAMGNPGPEDKHPLHGELPNAIYQEARLIIGEDEDGPFMALTGTYRHRVAFTHNYVAQPVVKLDAKTGRIRLSLSVRNLKHAPLELMYLAHINFRPVDNARIIDTVPDDPRNMRIRTRLPANYVPSPQYRQFLDEMLADPRRHREIVAGRAIDPELVLSLDCGADGDGWAHSAQMLPDGTADFVSHRPGELDRGVRWMSRFGDQDALGLMLPATADPNGYVAEKAQGRLRIIPPAGEFRCNLAFGALEESDAAGLKQKIDGIRQEAK
ncbi:DUF4432 family protein [Taklimakanibacter lacteus]|uniref:DUF4432 family protein n=1 Tax=Taklimakanibacter lacteus TaxID=2268456 RepID=UPI000E668D6E